MTDKDCPRGRLPGLPTDVQIQQAIGLYLELAYGKAIPEHVQPLLPPEQFNPVEWLAQDHVERTPPEAPLDEVRSFALRLGNRQYRNMKLRLSRPPKRREFIFMVDSHDAFLTAPEGSADHEPLEAMKRDNAALAAKIIAAWDQAQLPTERQYLRRKIRRARDHRGT